MKADEWVEFLKWQAIGAAMTGKIGDHNELPCTFPDCLAVVRDGKAYKVHPRLEAKHAACVHGCPFERTKRGEPF
jgi:hypothetical protein